MNRLTEDIAYKSMQKFFETRPFVLFGTGTSCAVDSRFGMGGLQSFLLNEMSKHTLSDIQLKEWNSVCEDLKNEIDFETSMNRVNNRGLMELIVSSTAKFIASIDKCYSEKILNGSVKWPAIKIIKKLVEGRVTDRILHVATTNYDCLAEYAFVKADVPYTTGFVGEIHRKLDWSKADKYKVSEETVAYGKQIRNVILKERHIRFYKVHGSLNTFKINNMIFENNSWMYDTPNGVERCLITPGKLKFECLLEDGNDLLKQFYDAFERHNAFLFIGFGFNDKQLINSKMMNKLCEQKNPGLIITKEINSRTQKLLNECDNLWIVCKQSDNDGTRIYNKRFANWIYMDDRQLWNTEVFANEILGG